MHVIDITIAGELTKSIGGVGTNTLGNRRILRIIYIAYNGKRRTAATI